MVVSVSANQLQNYFPESGESKVKYSHCVP